jgi:hypothetical protein
LSFIFFLEIFDILPSEEIRIFTEELWYFDVGSVTIKELSNKDIKCKFR